MLSCTKRGIIEKKRRRGQPIDYEKGAFVIYKVGDHLAHPGHGGCTIQELCKREYGGQTALYFVLMPASDSSITILAPVKNAEKIGLREIITIEEADQILIFLTEAKVEWISDNKKRSQAYDATLKSGNLRSLARMIKELLLHESMAVLSNFDREILPKAQRLLFSEIALAKGIDFEHTLCLANHAIMA